MFYPLKKSSIIDSVGREDRESLRRYPSARIDAETWAGASQIDSLLSFKVPCFGLKAINLGVWGRAPIVTIVRPFLSSGVPYGNIVVAYLRGILYTQGGARGLADLGL